MVTISDTFAAQKTEIATKEVPIVHTETKTITYEAAQVRNLDPQEVFISVCISFLFIFDPIMQNLPDRKPTFWIPKCFLFTSSAWCQHSLLFLNHYIYKCVFLLFSWMETVRENLECWWLLRPSPLSLCVRPQLHTSPRYSDFYSKPLPQFNILIFHLFCLWIFLHNRFLFFV